MESALRPLAEHLTCEGCQHALRDRIKSLVNQWSVVKVRVRMRKTLGICAYMITEDDMIREN